MLKAGVADVPQILPCRRGSVASYVSQLCEQDTGVVMVDAGNSYEGLCEYVGGKYISYTEEKPITMNPFIMSKEELNIEKVDFLKNVTLLIWKGSEGKVTELELSIVEQIVSEYYEAYFDHNAGRTYRCYVSTVVLRMRQLSGCMPVQPPS